MCCWNEFILMHSIMPLMFMAYGASEHQECRNVIWLRFRPISSNIYALKNGHQNRGGGEIHSLCSIQPFCIFLGSCAGLSCLHLNSLFNSGAPLHFYLSFKRFRVMEWDVFRSNTGSLSMPPSSCYERPLSYQQAGSKWCKNAEIQQ